MARTLYELAGVREVTGRNVEASRLLIRAIGILESEQEADPGELATAWRELGIWEIAVARIAANWRTQK